MPSWTERKDAPGLAVGMGPILGLAGHSALRLSTSQLSAIRPLREVVFVALVFLAVFAALPIVHLSSPTIHVRLLPQFERALQVSRPSPVRPPVLGAPSPPLPQAGLVPRTPR